MRNANTNAQRLGKYSRKCQYKYKYQQNKAETALTLLRKYVETAETAWVFRASARKETPNGRNTSRKCAILKNSG